MQNPWLSLPETPPFGLACDHQIILDFNNRVKPEYLIHWELLPEPYTGNTEAKILLLNSNPGFYKGSILGDDYFQQTSRANVYHTKQEYPFYLFNPGNRASLGYHWWSRKLEPLIALYGLKKVAQEIFNVEYFPYHSEKFGRMTRIPSQAYSIYLVQKAIRRNALIIQMRSKRVWQEAVPGLMSYHNYYVLRNPQNPAISHNNCPDGFPEILKILSSTTFFAPS
jgi:hypothetical protein